MSAPETKAEALARIGDLEFNTPPCSICGTDTDCDGDSFTCSDCGLVWGMDGRGVEYLDDDARPCGELSTRPAPAQAGRRFRRMPCPLPADHLSDFHENELELIREGEGR